MKTWTADQAGRFLAAVAADRLAPAWQLSLYGLRRGEILGLRWSDVDLDARTLTIRLARTSVAGEVLEGEPKTERSKRTLPLDDGLVAALRSLKPRQARERLEAGPAYSAGCGGCGGAHLVVDELGQPYRPEWYSDRFARIAKAAGLPAIRLHDARHTSVTLMTLRGVPVPVVSAWHGHASAAFALTFYAHSQDDALAAAGETLAAAHGRSEGAVKLS
jgi:integrase